MNREDYARVYRVKLALDLLEGLENPGSQVAFVQRDGSQRVLEHMYAREARNALAVEMLRAFGLDEADFFDLASCSDEQIRARLDRPSAREEAARREAEARERQRQQRAASTREERIRNRETMRGRPGPGSRPVRPVSSVLEAMRELARPQTRYGAAAPPVEVDAGAAEPYILPHLETPAADRPLDWTLRPTSTNPPTQNDLAPWSENDDPITITRADGTQEGIGVDINTGEIVWPWNKKGKKAKPTPKPEPKPGRRLVIGKRRPPVAPDD